MSVVKAGGQGGGQAAEGDPGPGTVRADASVEAATSRVAVWAAYDPWFPDSNSGTRRPGQIILGDCRDDLSRISRRHHRLAVGVRGLGTLLGFACLYFGNKYDARIWLLLGFFLQGASGWMMAQFDINVTTWDVAYASFLQGLGTGFLWVPLTLVTFNTLPQRLFPEGSSIFHLLRNIGSSVHISISVALVLHSSKINYGHLAESVSPYAKAWTLPSSGAAWDLESVQTLARIGGEVQRQGLMIGYINAFYFYTFTAVAALPLIMMVRMKKPPP